MTNVIKMIFEDVRLIEFTERHVEILAGLHKHHSLPESREFFATSTSLREFIENDERALLEKLVELGYIIVLPQLDMIVPNMRAIEGGDISGLRHLPINLNIEVKRTYRDTNILAGFLYDIADNLVRFETEVISTRHREIGKVFIPEEEYLAQPVRVARFTAKQNGLEVIAECTMADRVVGEGSPFYTQIYNAEEQSQLVFDLDCETETIDLRDGTIEVMYFTNKKDAPLTGPYTYLRRAVEGTCHNKEGINYREVCHMYECEFVAAEPNKEVGKGELIIELLQEVAATDNVVE